jgi:3-(3-hydroxy-phenyl)propionate hydroxylase
MVPGAPMDDAPMQVAGQDVWLLDQVGNRFMALLSAVASPSGCECRSIGRLSLHLGAAAVPVEVVLIADKPGPSTAGRAGVGGSRGALCRAF